MNKTIMNEVNELKEIFNVRANKHTSKNVFGKSIPAIDYLEANIKDNEITDDIEKMISVLDMFLQKCKENNTIDDFYTLIAAYCNLYMRWGIYLRVEDQDFGLSKFLKESSNTNFNNIIKNIIEGIKEQDYSYFEDIYRIDSKCSVCNLYLFVKSASEFCYSLAKNNPVKYEKQELMWTYYDNLNQNYKNYILGTGEFNLKVTNLASDQNILPHINFKSVKDYLNEYILMYYNDIVKELNLSNSKPSCVYNEFMNKLMIPQMQQAFLKFVEQLKSVDINEGLDTNTDLKLIIENKNIVLKLIDFIEYSTLFISITGNECINMSFRHMFEKLQSLNLKDENAFLEQSKFTVYCMPDFESSFAERNRYLHISLNIHQMSREHFLSMYDIYCKNKELDNKSSELTSLVNSFLHKNKNLDIDTISSLIDTLTVQKYKLSNPTIESLYNYYEDQRLLKQSLALMELEACKDYIALTEKFKDSICDFNDKNTVLISDIAYAAFNKLIIKLLYGNIRNKRDRYALDNITKSGKSEEELKQVYNDYVKNNNILALAEIFNLQIDIKSDLWDEIYIYKDSIGYEVLFSIFIEVFYNVLTYGDLSKNIVVELDNSKSKFKYLNIKVTNGNKNDNAFNFSNNGQGLKSTNDILILLNKNFKGENEFNKYLTNKQIDDKYITEIKLRDNLFL